MKHAPLQAGPLSGIRVVELGQVLAGPFAGAIFADLGAEVIKIERPDGGDDGRRMGAAFHNGDSMTFQIFNRGKQSVTVDLKDADGLRTLEDIVARADILVHNLRPGVVAELGIDGPTLCARHPRLVYCEMSAFGHTGPRRLQPGYEPLLQAFSGLSSINGAQDGPPMRMGASICDQGTGMWTVIGALAMLQQRQASGRGGIVNTSLFETALSWGAQKIDAFVNEGQLPQKHASGHPGLVPYEAFDAADAPLIVCVGNDRLFAKFAAALGRADWAQDPRFRTNRDRLRHKDLLLPQIAGLLTKQPRAHWLAALDAAGIPCSPILTIPEVVEEPQLDALGMLQPVPAAGFSLTALPVSFDGVRPTIRSAAPLLGEHNERPIAGGGATDSH